MPDADDPPYDAEALVQFFGGPYDGLKLPPDVIRDSFKLRQVQDDRAGIPHEFVTVPPLGAVESDNFTGRFPKINTVGRLPVYEAVQTEHGTGLHHRTSEDLTRILCGTD